MIKLEEIGVFKTGGTPSRKHPEYYGNVYPWVTSTALTKSNISTDDAVDWLSEEGLQKSSTKIIKPNSLMIGVRVGIGNCSINDVPMCTSQDVISIEDIDITRYYLPFLRLFIKSKHSYFERQKRGVTIKGISSKILKNLIIPNCSYQEQVHIAKQLEYCNEILERRISEIKLLDNLQKARFVEMFGDPQTNPYGFEKVTVGDVCSSIVRGPFGSALKKEFFVEKCRDTYKVYEQKHAIQKSADIGTYYITREKFDELKRFECKPGDILMSCSGTMGELYQLPEGCEKGIINQALCKFTLNDKILPIVFLIYMKETIGNLQTQGSGIKNVAAVSYVKAMPINLAPMEIQNQFATFTTQVDKSKAAIQKSIDETQLLYDSLMQKYFG